MVKAENTSDIRIAWRRWLEMRVKIIDEYNRIPTRTQSALLTAMAFKAIFSNLMKLTLNLPCCHPPEGGGPDVYSIYGWWCWKKDLHNEDKKKDIVQMSKVKSMILKKKPFEKSPYHF